MRNVVVTGVARGLGRALVDEFASRGITVYGAVRSEDDAEKFRVEFGPPHRFFAADVTDPESLDRLARAAFDSGGVDIVIANAGVINEREPLWEISGETWRMAMDINVLGMVNTIKAFLPGMIAADKGLFVGMSSGWGRSASAGLGPYCAGKFAVEGLMGSLALDLAGKGSPVAAVALDPGGGVNTDMLVSCLPDSHGDYRTADVWAVGAVDYIVNTLFANAKSGSREIPESAHAPCE